MRLEAGAYRAIGRVIGHSFGRLDGVLGVYARRSVATGEVAFARSDLDLHVLISTSSSLEDEGRLLNDVYRRYRHARRAVPCLGHVWISTRAGLEQWYREQPSEWYRDRGWLRLWGEEFDRPRSRLDDEGREGLLWWYSWATGTLTECIRAGNARRCWNLVLDLFDVYRLHTGLDEEPATRAELFELWWTSGTPTPERTAIARAARHGFRGGGAELLAAIYRESLSIHDHLFEHVEQLEGHASGRLDSSVPPLFTPRIYSIAEHSDRDGIERGLAHMSTDPGCWPLNERGLKIHLAYRNPWEHQVMAAANPGLDLSPPSRDAFERNLRRALHREAPRTWGFMGEPGFAGPLYAQRRLYRDSGFVALDAASLDIAYRKRYGAGLSTDMPVAEYFTRAYPVVCEIIDELRAATGLAAPAA